MHACVCVCERQTTTNYVELIQLQYIVTSRNTKETLQEAAL